MANGDWVGTIGQRLRESCKAYMDFEEHFEELMLTGKYPQWMNQPPYVLTCDNSGITFGVHSFRPSDTGLVGISLAGRWLVVRAENEAHRRNSADPNTLSIDQTYSTRHRTS